MTTKRVTKQYASVKILLMYDKGARLAIWKMARGIWKQRKIDPVRYQRKLRDTADHILV